MGITVQEYIVRVRAKNARCADELEQLNEQMIRSPNAGALLRLMEATWNRDRDAMKREVTKEMRSRIVESYAALRIERELRACELGSRFQLCDYRRGNRAIDYFRFDLVLRTVGEVPVAAVECKTYVDANMLLGPAARSYVAKQDHHDLACYLLTSDSELCNRDRVLLSKTDGWLDGVYALGADGETEKFLSDLKNHLAGMGKKR
jgi:hypothetical protein